MVVLVISTKDGKGQGDRYLVALVLLLVLECLAGFLLSDLLAQLLEARLLLLFGQRGDLLSGLGEVGMLAIICQIVC